jgi:hypothetical protein
MLLFISFAAITQRLGECHKKARRDANGMLG